MLIGLVASFVLALHGIGTAATFVGLVSTVAGLLCPSPIFRGNEGK